MSYRRSTGLSWLLLAIVVLFLVNLQTAVAQPQFSASLAIAPTVSQNSSNDDLSETMPSLNLEIEANPVVLQPGETSIIVVTVENYGNEVLQSVLLNVVLPDGLTTSDSLTATINSLESMGTGSFTFNVTMQPNAAGPQIMTVSASADGFTIPVTKQGAIEFGGGTNTLNVMVDSESMLSADGRVSLNLSSAKAMATTIVLEQAELNPPFLSFAHDYFFRLTDQSGASTLVKPIEIKVDLTGKLSIPEGSYPNLELFRYDESNQTWELVPGYISLETNILTATTDKLGLFGVASAADGDWTNYKQPEGATVPETEVSLYSGHFNYTYPIEVPTGRNGQRPVLNLTYNSGLVDGMTSDRNNQTSWVGLGWELGEAYISRKIKRDENHVPMSIHEYSIVMNGVSSKLVCVDSNAPKDCVDYHTENETFWRIQRLNTTENREGKYWLVTTKDGTQYRFGGQDETYGDDSRYSAWWMVATEEGSGTLSRDQLQYTMWRWNLDQIKDTHENIIRYDYDVERNFFGYCGSDCWFVFDRDIINAGGAGEFNGVPLTSQYLAAHLMTTDTAGYIRGGYLKQITYSWPGSGANSLHQIIFDRENRHDTEYDTSFVSVGNGNKIFTYQTFFTQQRLKRIIVKTGGHEVRVHDLEGIVDTVNGKWRPTTIRVSDQVNNGNQLPATTFDYGSLLPTFRSLPLAGDAVDEYFLERLDGINNGYGGFQWVNYTGVPNGQYIKENYTGSSMPGWWLGYRVRCSYTGLEEDLTTACNNNASGWHLPGFTVYEYGDVGWDEPDDNDDLLKEFRGHNWVAVYDPSGLKTTYRFHQGLEQEIDWDPYSDDYYDNTITDYDGLEGKLYQTETTAEDGTRIASTVTHYSMARLFPSPPTFVGKTTHITPYETRNYSWDGNSTFNRTQTRYIYSYPDGNLSSVLYFGDLDVNGDERTQKYQYYGNTNDWITNKIAQESLYSGIAIDGGTEELVAGTRYYYDGNSNWNQPPGATGELTRQDTWMGTGDEWVTTSQTYDPRGNLATTTDANGNMTEYIYDDTYETFLWTVINPLGHRYETRYDDKGRIYQEWGPDEFNTRIEYAYDGFGRLIEVVRPGETLNPIVKYEYNDFVTRGGGQQVDVSFADTVTTQRFFTDGLGRPDQKQLLNVPLGNGLTDVVSYTEYDYMGRVKKESINYDAIETGIGRVPNFLNAPGTTYTYDDFGRVESVTASDETQTTYSTFAQNEQ